MPKSRYCIFNGTEGVYKSRTHIPLTFSTHFPLLFLKFVSDQSLTKFKGRKEQYFIYFVANIFISIIFFKIIDILLKLFRFTRFTSKHYQYYFIKKKLYSNILCRKKVYIYIIEFLVQSLYSRLCTTFASNTMKRIVRIFKLM